LYTNAISSRTMSTNVDNVYRGFSNLYVTVTNVYLSKNKNVHSCTTQIIHNHFWDLSFKPLKCCYHPYICIILFTYYVRNVVKIYFHNNVWWFCRRINNFSKTQRKYDIYSWILIKDWLCITNENHCWEGSHLLLHTTYTSKTTKKESFATLLLWIDASTVMARWAEIRRTLLR
jgi:hypothetical protein